MVICPFFRINFLDVCKLIKPLVPITHISHFILFIPHPHTYTPSPSYSFLVSHPPSYTPHIYTTSHHIITFYYAQQHNTSHCITSLSNISLRIFISHHITSLLTSYHITSHHITPHISHHISSHLITSHSISVTWQSSHRCADSGDRSPYHRWSQIWSPKGHCCLVRTRGNPVRSP